MMGWVRRLRRWLIYGVLALGLIWAGLFLFLAPALPDTRDLRQMRKSPGITVVAADGSILLRRGAFNGVFLPLSALPPHMAQAVIATEDRRFYQHFGMDVVGFGRALWANIRAGRVVQGGSTITQQLAKNLYLTPERTIVRKLRELMLAIWLESRLTKDQILASYLNRVYLGDGTYGVEAASRKYFGKSARNVSLPEAAILAGLLKAPSRYAPTKDLKRSRARAAQVLQNMVEAGYLSPQAAARARRRPAGTVKSRKGPNRSRYFVDWVLDRLPDWASHAKDDLIVFTTLDPKLQRMAEAAVGKALRRYGKGRKVEQAALVSFDTDGAVKAMVGGRSYAKSQFNRAVQARRQPGSAFKPFVYLTALENGMSPASRMTDSPVSINGWKPQNHGGGYRGEVTLKRALADSINTVAVKLSEQVGRDKVTATVRRMGIKSKLAGHPSMALGTSELSLFELTAAYIPFANAGRDAPPYAVLEIRARDGGVIYRRSDWARDRVVDAQKVGAMNEMMSEVLRSGTGKAARLNGRPAAGKTGTTQSYRDGWFIGYTADYVTGVWLGNDDNRPMRRVTGGQIPARIWRQYMTDASRGKAVRALPDGGAGDAIALGDIFERVVGWMRDLTDVPESETRDPQKKAERIVRGVEKWLRDNSKVIRKPPGSESGSIPEPDEAE